MRAEMLKIVEEIASTIACVVIGRVVEFFVTTFTTCSFTSSVTFRGLLDRGASSTYNNKSFLLSAGLYPRARASFQRV